MPDDDDYTPLRSNASVLRDAGYVQLPDLWVKREDMPTIHLIAKQYQEEVNDLRGRNAKRNQQILADRAAKKAKLSDPKTDKDAAWEAHESKQMDPSKIDWPGMN